MRVESEGDRRCWEQPPMEWSVRVHATQKEMPFTQPYHTNDGSRLLGGEERANGQSKQAPRCVWGPLAMRTEDQSQGSECPYGNLSL